MLLSITVDQRLAIPSDHAPVSLVVDCSAMYSPLLTTLVTRADQLGDHAVLHPVIRDTRESSEPRRKRPLPFSCVDTDRFTDGLECFDIQEEVIAQDSLEASLGRYCDLIYDIAKRNLSTDQALNIAHARHDTDGDVFWNQRTTRRYGKQSTGKVKSLRTQMNAQPMTSLKPI